MLLDTQGYPFFIQLYGDALWKGTNSQPVIAEDDFRRLRPGIVDGLDRSFFESRYRRASAREQRVLRAMAAGGGEASTIEDLRQRLEMSNSELTATAEIPSREGADLPADSRPPGVSAPMFGAFLRRRRDHGSLMQTRLHPIASSSLRRGFRPQ